MKKIYLLPLITLFFGFNGLIKSATFTSVSSGTWSAPATWSVTGVDADGIPDSDDDVTINGGHTILLTSISNFGTLVINPLGVLNGNSQTLRCNGNFTNHGSVINFISILIIQNTVFTSTTVFTASGNWNVYANLTISSGTTLRKANYFILHGTSIVTNQGSVNLLSGSITLFGSSSWINDSNSYLEIAFNFSGNNNLIFNSMGNSVVYSSSANNIRPVPYYNLSLRGGGTKSVSSNLTVLNDFTLLAAGGNVLNLNNFNMYIGGSCYNLANTTFTNQGVITFNGTGLQNINRSTGQESFNNIVIATTGTVSVNSTLNVSQSLTVNSGVLDIATPSNVIFIRGNLINNSTINCRNATFTFNGTSLQSISGTSNTQFFNLTLNNNSGLIINSTQSLTNSLQNISGNFNSNGNFILISNASQTARIAPMGSGVPSFSGSMIIQKFISARPKGWHDLSSPVQNTTIFDWDDEMYMSGFSTSDNPSGIAGVDGTALDENGNFFYSAMSYNETIASFSLLTSSVTPLVMGRGYEIWLSENMSNWSAKTIDTRGVPNFGNRLVNLSYTPNAGGYGGLYDGLNLIGNPFASAVNYSACTKTNMVSGVLILDNSGNYNDYGPNAVIPPHQGIWVQASGPGASINFLENAKSTSNTTNFYRTAPDYGVKLVFSSPQLSFYNENTVNFLSSATSGFDKEYDAVYLKSPNKDAPAMYMAIGERGGLITNAVSPDEEEVTIPLSLFTPSKGIYYIESSVLNTASYSKVWIEHVKTGKKYDLKDGSIAIEGDENETNKNYVLRFSKSAENNTISQAAFENDLVVFNIENALILKANSSNHLVTSLSIYDLSGKLIMDYSDVSVVVGSTMEFDISNLAKGLYIVNAIDSNNHLITKKIVK